MAVIHPLPSGQRGVEVELEEVEVAMLQSLAAQLVEFVTPAPTPDADPLVALVGIDPEARTPDDPALRRLLPDAYRDDDEASAEFRRFTERDLREAKARHAQDVLEVLASNPERVRIDQGSAAAWLGFLNDTRLTLGSRLEISDESHDALADLPDEDPRTALYQVYDWLTFLQESVVQSLLAEA